jgi:hypothetical protein
LTGRQKPISPPTPGPTFKPPAVARAMGVGHDTVLGWIRSGELRASNLAPLGKRPRWIVTPEAIDEFLKRRQHVPPPKKPGRRRRPPGNRDYNRY